jgi:hypothetical protein
MLREHTNARPILRESRAKHPEKLSWIPNFKAAGQDVKLAQPIEAEEGFGWRGVDLNSTSPL